MKYFTSALFIRLQECEDATLIGAINEEWERAVQSYGEQLEAITCKLSGALRRFVKRGSLHDADVLEIGTTDRRLTMVLQEEARCTLRSLTYSLVEAPVIDRNAFPEEHRSPQVSWLYDELDVAPETLYHPKLGIQEKAALSPREVAEGGWRPIYSHSILFSNGWEIGVRFHALTDTRTRSLFRPDPRERRAQSASVGSA